MWLISDRIIGIISKLSNNPEEILIAQLENDGCGYQYSCEFDWEHYSGYNVRNKNMQCPMYAARCVVKLNFGSQVILASLKRALNSQPYEFDTGDGIIKYGSCLEGVIESIENKTGIIPPEC